MDGLYGVYRFSPSVVDLSPMLDVAHNRGYYGLDTVVCSAGDDVIRLIDPLVSGRCQTVKVRFSVVPGDFVDVALQTSLQGRRESYQCFFIAFQ